MTNSITSLLAAHHAQREDASPQIRLPANPHESPSHSGSPGNRAVLQPGGEAVIRIEVRDPKESDRWSKLTPRQFEVLEHLIHGRPTKLICRALDMSEGTAKVHISSILRALRVTNRSEVVLAALRAGWLEPASPMAAADSVGQEGRVGGVGHQGH